MQCGLFTIRQTAQLLGDVTSLVGSGGFCVRNIQFFTLCPIHDGGCVAASGARMDPGSDGGCMGSTGWISSLI